MSLATDIIPPADFDYTISVPVHGEPWIAIGGYTAPHSATAWVKGGMVIATLWGNGPTYYSKPGRRVDAPEFAWPIKHTP